MSLFKCAHYYIHCMCVYGKRDQELRGTFLHCVSSQQERLQRTNMPISSSCNLTSVPTSALTPPPLCFPPLFCWSRACRVSAFASFIASLQVKRKEKCVCVGVHLNVATIYNVTDVNIHCIPNILLVKWVCFGSCASAWDSRVEQKYEKKLG